jgi:hypothetical protein
MTVIVFWVLIKPELMYWPPKREKWTKMLYHLKNFGAFEAMMMRMRMMTILVHCLGKMIVMLSLVLTIGQARRTKEQHSLRRMTRLRCQP